MTALSSPERVAEFKAACEAPHLPSCCTRHGLDVLRMHERLAEISVRGAVARARATTEAIQLHERAVAGEEITEAERLRVLAIEREAQDLTELEPRGPKLLERAGKAAREHHAKCAAKRFAEIAAACDGVYSNVARVVAEGFTVAKMEPFVQTMQVLRASAWAWASSSGLGSRMPEILQRYFEAQRQPGGDPPIDAHSLLRAVVRDTSFAARVVAIQEG